MQRRPTVASDEQLVGLVAGVGGLGYALVALGTAVLPVHRSCGSSLGAVTPDRPVGTPGPVQCWSVSLTASGGLSGAAAVLLGSVIVLGLAVAAGAWLAPRTWRAWAVAALVLGVVPTGISWGLGPLLFNGWVFLLAAALLARGVEVFLWYRRRR
jgi:hypothetical protein